MAKKKRIRPLALCVFRRGDKIFVAEGHDKKINKTFYRPIGGGIDFTERAIETVRREVREEIEADVTNLVYLGTLENIFSYEGQFGHEICLMFDGDFVDDFRNVDDYTVVGHDDGDVLFTAMWKSLDFFRNGHAPLYPDGLLALLEQYDD
ncbi:MAG: NUDIX domain-containing protein [Anaerolineae bacterium]|nr:NUDIX domain-containing protein [Anaerolineae bacterium]